VSIISKDPRSVVDRVLQDVPRSVDSGLRLCMHMSDNVVSVVHSVASRRSPLSSHYVIKVHGKRVCVDLRLLRSAKNGCVDLEARCAVLH